MDFNESPSKQALSDAAPMSASETWTPATLKDVLRRNLAGDEIIVVSNREPYSHVRTENGIEVRFPDSGLVTALEPVLRACSGTWIAHGSGNADRESVDANDRVAVPPDDPAYNLRRVWLSPEEEKGYYNGFANAGLWPLCHLAHVRPLFRRQDWEHYQAVNRRFAEVVCEEARTEDPVILVQDYHFALLPRRIRELLPRATIVTFWHIPWPNPESFGICPWKEQILDGLLGSSVVGFHTRRHRSNFLDSVDRFLEARVDRDDGVVSLSGQLCSVRHNPISVEWPPRWLSRQPPFDVCRAEVRQRHEIAPHVRVGLGVDRLDYTKGIPERLHAIERLLELHPEWRGNFTFLQIAAPSRSEVSQYRIFAREVNELVDRINQRFGSSSYRPVILVEEHRDPFTVFEYFRGADLCFVSSLHDGMNLVAKEFISSREDEQGVLILSSFTGAAEELTASLLVNPYDVDECAEAMHLALHMTPEEQRDRMRAMRGLVRDSNVYRWAGRMLLEAGRIRKRNRLEQRLSHTSSMLDF